MSPAGEAERRLEPERNRLSVREHVPRRRLERVRERVAKVEGVARPAVVGVAQAEGCFVRGTAPHELLVGQLPEALTGEQTRLDHFGEPVAALLLGQRREQRRIDHRPRGPVEGADEVLPLRDVDRGLAPDRRIDLADQARRHRDPVDPAHVGRGREPGEIGGRPAAEADDQRRCARGGSDRQSEASSSAVLLPISCVVESRRPSSGCTLEP